MTAKPLLLAVGLLALAACNKPAQPDATAPRPHRPRLLPLSQSRPRRPRRRPVRSRRPTARPLNDPP